MAYSEQSIKYSMSKWFYLFALLVSKIATVVFLYAIFYRISSDVNLSWNAIDALVLYLGLSFFCKAFFLHHIMSSKTVSTKSRSFYMPRILFFFLPYGLRYWSSEINRKS